VNGLDGTRRSARPVRITLGTLGRDIDGAWWPHTSSVAAELPELIRTLHRPLGEVVEISVNWSPAEVPPDLNSICYGARSSPKWPRKRPRLMAVAGCRARANLLVVPHMTSTALGLMVLRRAAHLPIAAAHRDSELFATADFVVRAAQEESATWAFRPRDEMLSPHA
jgi:hypothetical protein